MVILPQINIKARFQIAIQFFKIISICKKQISVIFLEPHLSNGVTYCIDEDGNKIAETLKWDNAQVGSRFEECDAYRY